MSEFEGSSDIYQIDNIIYRRMKTMPWLKQLVSGFSHWMPRFTFSVILVGFVVEQGFL
jgi:type II secretory pathway component PulF